MKTTRLLSTALLATVLCVAGVAYAHEQGGPEHKECAGKGWGHHHDGVWSLLPESKQKLLHDTMKKAHEDNKALKEQGHKLHEELDAMLKAPTFDQNAYLQKHAELDSLHDKIRKNKEKAFASVAAKFTPEERKVLLVLHHLKHHHHHGGGWHHEDAGMHTHDGNKTGMHHEHDGDQKNPSAEN